MAIGRPKSLLEKIGIKKNMEKEKVDEAPSNFTKEDNKHFVGLDKKGGQNE